MPIPDGLSMPRCLGWIPPTVDSVECLQMHAAALISDEDNGDNHGDGVSDDVTDGDDGLLQEEVGRLCLSHVCRGRANGGEAMTSTLKVSL